MTSLARRSPLVCLALVLALTACTDSKTATPGPSAPSGTPTPTPPRPTAATSEPPVYRYQNSQLAAAVPAKYGTVVLDVDTATFQPNATYTPRPDPLAGLSVEPESCRSIVRGVADPTGQYGGLPSLTPGGNGYAPLGERVEGVEPYVSVLLVELTGAKATDFVVLLPAIGPECADIKVTGGKASAVERSLPEYGPQSRYIVRSYPLGGKQWIERILLYPSAHYVTEVRLWGPANSETDFLTFARQVRDRAAQKLK